jgi:hypothetical protein
VQKKKKNGFDSNNLNIFNPSIRVKYDFEEAEFGPIPVDQTCQVG